MAEVVRDRAPRAIYGEKYDPFLLVWRLLTSVRFAILLIAFLIAISIVGLLVPQIPTQIRGNEAQAAMWMATQNERYGAFAGPMQWLGFFDVFRSLWFLGGMMALVSSVSVCTFNRFAPIWRNIRRPQERVPDEFFERGQPAVVVPAPEISSLVSELRRRRYRVVVSGESSPTYLFADRFPWAQLATFVSHLALILFLAGGLVTLFTAREADILVAESETWPVFNPSDRDHMQIYVEDAVGRFSDSGFPLDYRTELVVYKDGAEVARGVTTVNDPLSYGGFKFHQTAYFPDGVAVSVRDAESGRLLYDEILALTDRTPAPEVTIRDERGNILLADVVVPTDSLGTALGTVVTLPGVERMLWIGTQPSAGGAEWRLVVFSGGASGQSVIVGEGNSGELPGLTVEFTRLTDVASAMIEGIPGAGERSFVQLSQQETGSMLTISPIAEFAANLAEGDSVVVGDYEYEFVGQREFAGITVRRDPGATVIWVASGLLLAGLALTFYTPRRRLWAKVENGHASFRGLGGATMAVEREIMEISERAAAEPRSS